MPDNTLKFPSGKLLIIYIYSYVLIFLIRQYDTMLLCCGLFIIIIKFK